MIRGLIFLALLISAPCIAQQATIAGPISPCTAFGTSAGSCAQGNDSRITGAIQSSATAATAWTPGVNCASGTVTTATTAGYYNQVGNSVKLHFTIAISNLGSCSGAISITGSPFTQNATASYYGSGILVNYSGIAAGAGYTTVTTMMNPASSAILLLGVGTGVTGAAAEQITAAMLTAPTLIGDVDMSQ